VRPPVRRPRCSNLACTRATTPTQAP
jgi:hypothetical protein